MLIFAYIVLYMIDVELLINKLLEEFLEEQDNRSSGTKILYRKTIGYFIVWMTKEKDNGRDISAIDKADAIAYRDHLRAKGNSSSTIDNYMSALRKFSKWLKKSGYYEKNFISKKMKWDRDKDRMFIKSALTLEQVDRLLDYTNRDTINAKRNNAIIHLMSFTGLRCIEITRLTFGDIIEGESGSIKLQVQRKGKREKGGVVTISQEILKPLRKYWSMRADPMGDTSPLFVNHAYITKDTALAPVTISRIVKESLRGIGLDSRRYSAHSLRHTAATLAVLAGAELWEVGQMLGHTNLQQTERYIHLLGFDIGPEGHAISKIQDYARKQRESTKKGHVLI